MEIDNIKDNDFISLFDMQLGKKQKENPESKIIGIISYKIKLVLENSPHFMISDEKNKIRYFYRGVTELIVDDTLDSEDNEYYFISEDEYNGK